jgi:hypothetical protein
MPLDNRISLRAGVALAAGAAAVASLASLARFSPTGLELDGFVGGVGLRLAASTLSVSVLVMCALWSRALVGATERPRAEKPRGEIPAGLAISRRSAA